MKIYYVVNARVPTERAHGVQIAKMCEAFAAQGHDVSLIIPDRIGSGSWDELAARYRLHVRFEVVRLPVIDLLPRSIPGGFLLLTWTFARSLRKYFRAASEGVVYTRGESVLFLSKFLPAHFPLIWETHIKPTHIARYRRALRRASGIVVATSHYATEAPALFAVSPEHILCAPDGVTLEDFMLHESKESLREELALPQEKSIVLYAGSDLAWKNTKLLYAAAELLPESFEVVVVGNITPQPGRNLSFVGYHPYHLIPKYLKAADALVLLGDSGSPIARFYTSPLKLFEYMAAANPIVAVDLPSYRDIISEHNAFLTESTPSALARALQNAMSPEGRLRAGRAETDVAKYAWSARAEHILSFISSL